MTKSKEKKREKISIASEIDRLEERRVRYQNNLEKADHRSRRENLTEQERQAVEDEMSIMNDRIQKLDKELESLRGENRKHMLLSVALLVVSALIYYAFFYSEEES